MTPLAMMLAREALSPGKAKGDHANVAALIGQDLHCFDVTAVGRHVADAMDHENLWPDVETMLPQMFLPSPVTWLEMSTPSGPWAYVLQQDGDWFSISMCIPSGVVHSTKVCDFRARGVLEVGERIELRIPEIRNDEEPAMPDFLLAPKVNPSISGQPIPLPGQIESASARVELLQMEVNKISSRIDHLAFKKAALDERTVKFGIAFSVLAIGLINTPGLIGLKTHAPHRGLAKRFLAIRAGSYPLRGWSEIVLKHETRLAGDAAQITGPAYHKCLHFVRSHKRHYRDGKVAVIPAHWRGDPALGIKRTRYRVAA